MEPECPRCEAKHKRIVQLDIALHATRKNELELLEVVSEQLECASRDTCLGCPHDREPYGRICKTSITEVCNAVNLRIVELRKIVGPGGATHVRIA